MNENVPSIGSMIQRPGSLPDFSPNSSPTIPCVGNSASMRPRSSSSAPRSAAVTGVLSAFIS